MGAALEGGESGKLHAWGGGGSVEQKSYERGRSEGVQNLLFFLFRPFRTHQLAHKSL